MPICKKCGDKFPHRVWIGEKKINLQNRRYCFGCSPFGSHNTKQIHLPNCERIVGARQCITCGKDINVKWRRGHRCDWCLQKIRIERVRNKVHHIVGNACWLCGYDKGINGRRVLDFHHMHPEEKKFNLSVRNMCNLKWSRVYDEIRKCILVCCRCHREIEYGLVDGAIAEKIYRDFWMKLGE